MAKAKKRSPEEIQRRRDRFIPGGVPRYIRCYDNHGTPTESADRYTVVYTGRSSVLRAEGGAPEYPYVTMSAEPFHPQGIGMHGTSKYQPIDTVHRKKPGWHWPPAVGRLCLCGRRIEFADLPEDCQRLVIRDVEEIWDCAMLLPRFYIVLRELGGRQVFVICDRENSGITVGPAWSHRDVAEGMLRDLEKVNSPYHQQEESKRAKAVQAALVQLADYGRECRAIDLG
jgi:hypothetical protein